MINLIGWTAPDWLVVFALLLLTALIHIVVALLCRGAIQRALRSQTVWDELVLQAARRPLVLLIWAYGIYFAISYLRQSSENSWAEVTWFDNAIRVGIVAAIAWFGLRFVASAETVLLRLQRQQNSIESISGKLARDETSLAAISKLLRACIFITAALLVLQQLGVSISGLLAFGGVGGLVLGFAAQQLLANFFGGLMLYLERPFKVGDWVRSPEKDIEGTIEDIGWRLTRIRTFDQRPIYVPNSIFNSITVENASRMLNRRIHLTLGIRYQDFQLLPHILADIRALLASDAGIDQQQTTIVNFDNFGSYSLDIYLSCYTRTCDWAEYHACRERILLAIGAIINQRHADFAFPTSTLWLNQDQPKPTPR